MSLHGKRIVVTRPAEQAGEAQYRMSGARDLRPVSVGEDGAKTYITWGADQAIPAVFAVDPAGKEEMVDGYVRSGTYTIDRVCNELVFRMDRQLARAKRIAVRGRN